MHLFFLQKGGNVIELTEDHLIYTTNCHYSSPLTLVHAKQLKVSEQSFVFDKIWSQILSNTLGRSMLGYQWTKGIRYEKREDCFYRNCKI